MIPPLKPPRRPLPDARGLPVARHDVVPGIPKQAPSPRAVELAREAARKSSPEMQDVRLKGLDDRVENLESRVGHMSATQERVATSVDKLVVEVGEWKLKAVDSETVKVREEHKTKRWVALIGLITMIVAPTGTITANYLTRDTSPQRTTEVVRSAMQNELDACQKAPSDQAWAECIRDASIRNAPQRSR